MSTGKRISFVFLIIINLINIVSGIIAQLKICLGKDITSIIPITAPLSVNQVLMVNFACVTAILMLICIVTTYLVTDVPYSPIEILSSCAGIFLVLPIAILLIGVFNIINAPLGADKAVIALCSIFHLLACIVNVSCLITVKED